MSWLLGTPEEQVGASSGDLFGMGAPLDPGFDIEANAHCRIDDLVDRVEAEVEVDSMSPPLRSMDDLGADVEGDQGKAARCQHPAQLAHGGPEFGGCQMDDGVQDGGGGELPVVGGEIAQIAHSELEVRVES